jgi:hypothetical protein
MTKPDRISSIDSVEVAIARVLDAEIAARNAIRDAERMAAAITEAARAGARGIALRAERRIGTVRAAFEARVAAEVADLDTAAAAAAAPHALTPEDFARVELAAAALARELTADA